MALVNEAKFPSLLQWNTSKSKTPTKLSDQKDTYAKGKPRPAPAFRSVSFAFRLFRLRLLAGAAEAGAADAAAAAAAAAEAAAEDAAGAALFFSCRSQMPRKNGPQTSAQEMKNNFGIPTFFFSWGEQGKSIEQVKQPGRVTNNPVHSALFSLSHMQSL